MALISDLTDKKTNAQEGLNCTQCSDQAEIQIKICPALELTVHSTMLYHVAEGLK